jgi:hypothetical protein
VPLFSVLEIGKDGEKKLEDGEIGNIMDVHSKKIDLQDVSCPLCKEMLYEPSVLNCGHGKF